MKEQNTVITRKGQVTIPIAMREALDLKEGDSVTWSLERQEIRLRRSTGVVQQTAGILKYSGTPLAAEEENAAVERAIAEEVIQSMEG